jgi:hypothetical protein
LPEQITLGTVVFRTKREATAEVRRILHSAPIEVAFADRDLTLIAALFDRHPRRPPGEVVKFCVGINNYRGALTRGFQAHFADGEVSRFSYIPCLSPTADSPSLVKVMRAAIMLSQRVKLREYYRGRPFMPCHECKADVEISVAHVHHTDPKFQDIADHFVSLIGVPGVVSGAIDELGDEFADMAIKACWIAFHDAVAQRVVVCAACNWAAERQC